MATPNPNTIPLPDALNPDSIDTLPVLAEILSRLQNLSPEGTTGVTPSATPSHSQGLLSSSGVISTKDLPTATDGLKHKLQKARGQVRELPDIQRSVKDQEEEIGRLEERIRKQKEVLEGLRAVGESARRGREMDSVEKMEGQEV